MTAVVTVQVTAVSTGRWRSTEHSHGDSVFTIVFEEFSPIKKLLSRKGERERGMYSDSYIERKREKDRDIERWGRREREDVQYLLLSGASHLLNLLFLLIQFLGMFLSHLFLTHLKLQLGLQHTNNNNKDLYKAHTPENHIKAQCN